MMIYNCLLQWTFVEEQLTRNSSEVVLFKIFPNFLFILDKICLTNSANMPNVHAKEVQINFKVRSLCRTLSLNWQTFKVVEYNNYMKSSLKCTAIKNMQISLIHSLGNGYEKKFLRFSEMCEIFYCPYLYTHICAYVGIF